MNVDFIYAAIATKDLAIAEIFYTKLLDKGPDNKPMPSLMQWENIAGAGLQVFVDVIKAGTGSITMVVSNVDLALRHLNEAGLTCAGIQQGKFGKYVQVADPDGNLITIAEPLNLG